MNANVKTPNVRSKKQDKAAKRAETKTKADAAPLAAPEKKQALAGTQTLARGLEVIDAVAQGATSRATADTRSARNCWNSAI
jgi:hypothetical protein